MKYNLNYETGILDLSFENLLKTQFMFSQLYHSCRGKIDSSDSRLQFFLYSVLVAKIKEPTIIIR